MIKERDYQTRAIDTCFEFLTRNTKQKPSIFVAPVASGKSIIIGGVVSRLEEATLVLQPSKELLEQNYAKYKMYGGEASLYSASVGKKEIGHTMYGTLKSMKNIGEELRKYGIKNVIIDECFTGDTFISTEEGSRRIQGIYSRYQRGEVIPKVKSYNKEKDQIEYKEILGIKKYNDKQTIVVCLNHNRKIKCTPNHPFLTNIGWVNAIDLKKNDILLTSCMEKEGGFLLNPSETQLQVIYGSQLREGYVEYKKRETQGRLKIIHGANQKDYLEYKNKLLWSDSIEYIEKNGYTQKPAYRLQTNQFFFPYTLEECIKNINLQGLSILWSDNGHLYKKENGGTLYSMCDNLEIISLLNKKINTLCLIKGKIISFKKNNKTLYFIRYNKSDVELFTSLLAKYTHHSMSYKIISYERENCRGISGVYNNYQIRIVERVLGGGKEDVYDLEVKDNHNFIISTQNSENGEIVHNCHLGYSPNPGGEFRTFMKALNPKRVLGFTATPIRLKTYGNQEYSWSQLNFLHKAIPRYFNDILEIIPIQDMVDKGFWSKLVYEAHTFSDESLVLNSTGSEFTQYSIDKSIQERNVNNLIYKRIKGLLVEGRKNILVFMNNVDTAEKMASLFEYAYCVHSKTPGKERASIIDNFKKGKVKIVTNFGTLTTGFDHEELDTIILGRPTNSVSLYYQMVGRGTRIHKDKDNCLIIDYCGNVKRFGKLEDFNFENIDGYGWGFFTNERLISGIPMDGSHITKEDIYASIEDQLEDLDSTKLWFGKYNGQRLVETPKDYLQYILDNFDFKSHKLKLLKKQIKQILLK